MTFKDFIPESRQKAVDPLPGEDPELTIFPPLGSWVGSEDVGGVQHKDHVFE